MENLGTSSFLAGLKELVNQKKDNYIIEKLYLSVIEEIYNQRQNGKNVLSRAITLKIRSFSCNSINKKITEKTFFNPFFSYPSSSIEDLDFAKSFINPTIDSQHISNRFSVTIEEGQITRTTSSPKGQTLEKDRELIDSIPDMSPEVANSFFDILIWNQEQDNILASTEIENKGLNNITVLGSDIIRAELKYRIDSSIRYKFDYKMKKSINYLTKEEEI